MTTLASNSSQPGRADTIHIRSYIKGYILYFGNALLGHLHIDCTDILRAAKILHQMEKAYALEKGAFGLDLEGGGKEMIDAPMLKQV